MKQGKQIKRFVKLLKERGHTNERTAITSASFADSLGVNRQTVSHAFGSHVKAEGVTDLKRAPLAKGLREWKYWAPTRVRGGNGHARKRRSNGHAMSDGAVTIDGRTLRVELGKGVTCRVVHGHLEVTF